MAFCSRPVLGLLIFLCIYLAICDAKSKIPPPKFDEDKLDKIKPFSNNGPLVKNLDIMMLTNLKLPIKKEIIFLYDGKWSLQSLVDSGEFGLLIPMELLDPLGHKCSENEKELHRIKNYFGTLRVLNAEINGEPTLPFYGFFGCRMNEMKEPMLWGPYDEIRLNAIITDKPPTPMLLFRRESQELKLKRYEMTSMVLKNRYGDGSGFWRYSTNYGHFGPIFTEELNPKPKAKKGKKTAKKKNKEKTEL